MLSTIVDKNVASVKINFGSSDLELGKKIAIGASQKIIQY